MPKPRATEQFACETCSWCDTPFELVVGEDDHGRDLTHTRIGHQTKWGNFCNRRCAILWELALGATGTRAVNHLIGHQDYTLAKRLSDELLIHNKAIQELNQLLKDLEVE